MLMNQDVGNSSGSNKRRKNESKVWEEMIKYKRADGREWAKCTHCEKEFDGSSKKGTTHLKNHLERCRCKKNGGEDASKSMKTSDLTSPAVIKQNSVIDLIKYCFDENGRPTEHWNPAVLNCRKVDILQVYKEEKEKLCRFFSELTCRFSLRIEWFWGWCFLIVHYIDDSWEQKMKIICFQNARSDFRNLLAILKESCLDWKIDGNICSIVNDCRCNDDDVIEEINNWFNQRGSLPLGGFQYSTESLSGILYNYYVDLRSWLWNTYGGMKECIDYINRTPSNQDKFQAAVNNAKSMGKKVSYESFPTHAHSLVHFHIALGYKEAFRELEQSDPDFKSLNLTNKQWDEAGMTCEHLKKLLISFRSLFEKYYTTPNRYFPKFCDIYETLLPLERSEGYHLGGKTSTMTQKFASVKQEFLDSYCSKSNLVLMMAVVLDPRFKMDIVQLWYNKIYGIDADRYLKKIINDFNNIYNEYCAKAFEPGFEDAASSTSYLDAMGRSSTSSHNVISSKSSELERYLNEPKFPSIENFDILAWWRAYNPVFPTLARMARDFLAVPVAVDNDELFSLRFDTVDCIVNCEDLDDDVKPALLCLTTWFKTTCYEK
ncbi:Zinc finger BED domain-containing protein [Melia azedarach]|nr:Zinc finger BED domain-containing protein [Melia azedarach]